MNEKDPSAKERRKEMQKLIKPKEEREKYRPLVIEIREQNAVSDTSTDD